MLAIAAQAQEQHEKAGVYSAPDHGGPLCTLRILVSGFRNNKGLAGGVAFATPAGWPENTAKAAVHGGFPIVDRQATEIFHLSPGTWGVAVIHDENSNRKLDRNFLGVPKEGFGFANNPRVFLSAPPFQAASVQVGCPVTEIHVRLIYK